ncbi:MAG: hypothetical protein COB04_18755 [Gammaproteobacteria bacterium]|nr:MAG: hypothetical protein COB04_18755 [Gammaproteobacteria bacterium]
MARLPSGRLIGTLDVKHLVSLIGNTVEVRRSKRKDPAYPLYLSTCIGPIHLNHDQAQEMVLENAVIAGAGESVPVSVPATEVKKAGSVLLDNPGMPVPAPDDEIAPDPSENAGEPAGIFGLRFD